MNSSPYNDFNVLLSRRVAETLVSYEPDAFEKIKVIARADIVTLQGDVATEQLRDQAKELAQATSGVAHVLDQLVVRSAPPKVVTAFEIPLTTAMPRAPWWQRAAAPAATITAGFLAVYLYMAWFDEFVRPRSRAAHVTGSVYFEGYKASGAKLAFYPLDSADALAGRPTAVTDEQGDFALGADGEVRLTPGRYVVTARWHPTVRGAVPAPGDNVVPELFADPRTTPLLVEVPASAEEVRLPDLHLARSPVSSSHRD